MITAFANALRRATAPELLDSRSRKNLEGVHEDLIAVVERASRISEVPFVVTEGLRSLDRQRVLVASGASRTLRSRHLHGYAVDLAAKIDGQVRWDWPLYAKLNDAMQAAADELDVPIIWGGSWRSFKDGPHWELDRRSYPDPSEAA